MIGRGKISALVNKYSYLFFVFLLVLSIQFSSQIVLDGGLMFRAILISLITVLWIVVILLTDKSFRLYIDQATVLSFLLLLYVIGSIAWAHNYTLSIDAAMKPLLFFVVFLLLTSVLQLYGQNFLDALIKVIILAFLFSLFTFVSQALQLKDFSYSSLYTLPGISGHKNLYSDFVFLTLIASLLGLQYLRKERFWHIVVLVTILLQFAVIFILRSRNVWIACFISALTFIMLRFRLKQMTNKKLLSISFGLTLIVTFLFVAVLPLVFDEYISSQIKSDNIEQVLDVGTFNERILVWQKSYDLIYDNLLFGVGAGNWKIMISQYAFPDIYKVQDLNVVFQRPHNEFLRILAENGILGFAFLVFIISYFLLLLSQVENRLGNKRLFRLTSGFVGFICVMMFSFPLERLEHDLILTFLLSIAHYLVVKNSKTKKRSVSVSKYYLVLPLLVVLLVLGIAQSKYKSSFYLKKMFIEREYGNNEKVIAYSALASTFFTNTDNYSVPIKWYSGNAYANMQNFEQALIDFRLAVHHHPNNTHVLNDLASAYFVNNNVDSAMLFYEKSALINPRFDEPRLNLVALYINQGDYVTADVWERSILHDSKRRIYYQKILLQEGLGSLVGH